MYRHITCESLRYRVTEEQRPIWLNHMGKNDRNNLNTKTGLMDMKILWTCTSKLASFFLYFCWDNTKKLFLNGCVFGRKKRKSWIITLSQRFLVRKIHVIFFIN